MKIKKLIEKELEFQQKQLKLIPSENYVETDIMNAVGSILMNKYAEGQAGKRYYSGNQIIDKVENICKKRALKLFNLSKINWHVNVQAVTGSIANLATLNAMLKPGDKIFSMALPDGGHISHGWKLPNGKKITITSKLYDSHFYNVSRETHQFDYDQIEKQAQRIKPKLIISGGTAYPRLIDHKKLANIAHKIGAYYLADIAHEAGLIAAKVNPSPFDHADFVTMTTRKTLQGPIGALIFAHKKHSEVIDRSVFPGIQGGPMINSIAGIAIALRKANTAKFRSYAKQVIKNAQTLAKELASHGFNVITGGTDKHLILMDITNKQTDGHIAAYILEHVDIITNKNTIPRNHNTSPWRPSGLRLGTPAITTRGMKTKQMKQIANLINETINVVKPKAKTKNSELTKILQNNKKKFEQIKSDVHRLTAQFPIYTN